MLAVPCGLQTYMGAWPPVVPGATMIQPLAELAACTAHSAAAGRGGTREEHADHLEAVAERDRFLRAG
jgi:hypothetical protein